MMSQQYTLRFISMLLCLSALNPAHGQIHSAYHIGSIGMMGSVNPVFSGPVEISNKACITVSNGVKTMQLAPLGVFNISCPLQSVTEPSINFQSYPNPFTNSCFIKSEKNIFSSVNTPVMMEMIDANGKLLQTYTTDISKVNQGYEIKPKKLAAGIYFIKITYSSTYSQFIKLIKSE